MDFVDLVKFVLAGEQWEEAEDLEEDAAHTPDVHFVVVVSLGQETLRGPVPPGGDVLCVALPLYALARPKVDEFYLLILQQDVFSE